MLSHPFAVFRPFQSRLSIDFLTRGDNASSDDDIARITGAEHIASLHQVHGTHAVRVEKETRRVIDADALATDRKNLTLTIRFADCQNFIVFDPVKNLICLIHAGWRGIAKGTIPSAFAFLKKEWSIDPADVVVAAGPSLCTACADFTDPKKEVPELEAYISGHSIDLVRAADDQLRSLGVKKERYERMPGCTRCSPDLYFTYRGGDREAVQKGFTNCFAVSLKS